MSVETIVVNYCSILPASDYDCLCTQAGLRYWLMFFFRRLKINHDSHEFILVFSTVANSKKRKINGEPAMPILVVDGEKGWSQPSANGGLFKLYFFHATSPSTVVPDIYVVWVESITTMYMYAFCPNVA
jgi:hypothetical protein